MEKEERLNPQQSLTLITEIIAQTKYNFKHQSFIFLLWGWTLALASILRFVLQSQTDYKYYFIPFPILTGIALLVTLIYYQKKGEKTNETHLNYFIRKLWTVLILGFIITVFVSVFQNVEPFTYTLILAGIGTLISGQMMKFKPLIFGGICFLLASICCVFVADEFKVLLHALTIIIGYIIPGYILKNSKQ